MTFRQLNSALWVSFLLCCPMILIAATEQEIVERFARIATGKEPNVEPIRFQQVSPEVIQAHRIWLRHTVERLAELIREDPTAEHLQWKTSFGVDQLRSLLSQPQPNFKELQQIQLRFQVAASTLMPAKELVNSLTLTNEDSQVAREKEKQFHAVRSVRRALNNYLALLEDEQHPELAESSLQDRLQQLAVDLNQYAEVDDQDKKQKYALLNRIHDQVNALRERHQAISFTQEMRQAYLHPAIGFYVSTNLLNLAEIRLNRLPINESKNGFRVRGSAKPRGLLKIQTIPNHDYATLEAGYCDPVDFCGTVSRKRLSLGLSAGLNLNLTKQFYINHGTLDSGATSSSSRFLYADSSKGLLIDSIVSGAVQKEFNGNQISGQLEDEIDRVVTRLANQVSLQHLRLVRNLLRSKQYPRERVYRTTDSGIQFQLMSARLGFHSPITLPENVNSDVVLNLHESLKEVLNSVTRESLEEWLRKAVEERIVDFSGINQIPIEKVWTKEGEFMDVQPDAIVVNFWVQLKTSPEEYQVRLSIRTQEGIVPVTPNDPHPFVTVTISNSQGESFPIHLKPQLVDKLREQLSIFSSEKDSPLHITLRELQPKYSIQRNSPYLTISGDVLKN